MLTINVAQQYGEQGSKGSLEAWKRADLVILDQNPLKAETIKEGKTIYQRAN